MQIYFVVALVFAVLVSAFAIQNSTPVHIQFLFWEIEQISQVLVILGAAAIGALAVLFLSITKQIRLAWQIKQLTEQNTHLKEEFNRLSEKYSIDNSSSESSERVHISKTANQDDNLTEEESSTRQKEPF